MSKRAVKSASSVAMPAEVMNAVKALMTAKNQPKTASDWSISIQTLLAKPETRISFLDSGHVRISGFSRPKPQGDGEYFHHLELSRDQLVKLIAILTFTLTSMTKEVDDSSPF